MGKPHSDNAAIDNFAAAMKKKMAKKRREGKRGWRNKNFLSDQELSQMLLQHALKGDPVDVANFAMMLHQRGERIVFQAPTSTGRR